MTFVTYPLDDIDYSAENAELFHCTRNSGIYAEEDFAISVTGADNVITIGSGIGWIRNAKFKGKVIAMKEDTQIDMGLPDAAYPRIDVLAVRFTANGNATTLVVKNGTPASSPVIPTIAQTEAVYELYLCAVRREVGATAITAKDITDLRLDPKYCGLMANAITSIDTSAINAQITALIQQLREEIANVKAGTAYVMKTGDTMTGPLTVPAPGAGGHAANKEYVDGKFITTAVVLSASGWAENLQTVAVGGVTADPNATDVFASPDPGDENYTAYIDSGIRLYAQLDGAVTFKCVDAPSVDITVYVAVRK